MADVAPITFVFYGFLKEQEAILASYFANADKWDPPWELAATIEDARVVIVNLSPEESYEKIEQLERELPAAEVVVFSSAKPPQALWHLERLPNGKVPIVAFSKLVLKISHALKRKKTEVPGTKTETIGPIIAAQPAINETTLTPIPEQEELEQESADMSSFFNQLDSLLDSKPNEKRKRFNEK